MRSTLASAVLLAACGGTPFEEHGGCGDWVLTEDRRDCDCLGAQQTSAELVLGRMGLTPPAHVRAWVRASDESFAAGDSFAYGLTLGPDDIELTRWGDAWPHELLHVLELRDGVPRATTAAHVGWRERGWLAATDVGEPHCD